MAPPLHPPPIQGQGGCTPPPPPPVNPSLSTQPWIKWFINTSFIHFSKTVHSVFIQVNWSSGSPVQSPHSETM